MESTQNVKQSKAQLKTYSPRERNMYLIGLAGQNIIYNIIGTALAYYLQFTLLIPAMTVSVIFTIARVWDAVNDPIMGTLVDRTRTKWGKCRPFLLFIPIPIFAITVACFANFGFYDASLGTFEGQNAIIVVWAAVTYILWGMLYTVGDIPLWGIIPLMTESGRDREKLVAWARMAAGVGAGVCLLSIQSVCLALGSFFTEQFDMTAMEGERMGFIVGAAGYALVATIMFQLPGLFARERVVQPTKKRYTLRENLKIVVQNKPFRQMMLSGLLGSPKQLVMLCAIPLVTYYYASKDPLQALLYLLLLGGAVFLGQFAAMAMVPVLLKRVSKKNLYNWSNLIGIPPYLVVFICYLIAPSDLTQPIFLAIFFVMFTVAGGGLGISMVMQSSMIADAIDYEEYHNRRRPDAVFFSGQSFITKLSAGLATIISGIAYTVAGFSGSRVQEVNDFVEAGGIPRENPEFSSYLMALFFLVSIPPAIGSLLAVIPTWKYSLTDEEHAKMLDELNDRRHGEEEGEPEAEA